MQSGKVFVLPGSEAALCALAFSSSDEGGHKSFHPPDQLQGEPAARGAQLVPQILGLCTDFQHDRKKSRSIKCIPGSQ